MFGGRLYCFGPRVLASNVSGPAHTERNVAVTTEQDAGPKATHTQNLTQTSKHELLVRVSRYARTARSFLAAFRVSDELRLAEPAPMLSSLRSQSLTTSLWRRRISAALSLGGKMRAFDATHVLALCFPIAGMVPAVATAMAVYYAEDTSFRGAEEADPMLRFTPRAIYPEPFAGLSNVAYIASGLALFLMPLLSGSFLAPHAIGAGVLFAFLGAGSWAFHKDASHTGGWQHAADRIGMFSSFSYLGIVVLGGAFHTITGRAVTPRSRCALATNLACMGATVVCITYQDLIPTRPFLALFGTVVVAANSLTSSLLALRTRAPPIRRAPAAPPPLLRRGWAMRCGSMRVATGGLCDLGKMLTCAWPWAVLEGLADATICCLLLFVGLALNADAASSRDAAAFNSSLPAAARIELRARHDLLHGTWHCLSAIAMLVMALTMHRGLCSLGDSENSKTMAVLHEAGAGRDRPTNWANNWEERLAKVLCGLVALLMWLIRDSAAEELLLAWVLVTCVTLPFGAISLLHATRRIDARWAAKRRALGATSFSMWRTTRNSNRPAVSGRELQGSCEV